MKNLFVIFLFAFISVASFAVESHVYFELPKNGTTVSSPVKIKFGVTGKKVRPAGEVPEDKNFGHHHVIVDGDSIPAGQVVPADATHIHFGKGQTETELPLSPGTHRLTLQFADGAHRSYGPEFSQSIEVKVKK